MNRCHHDRIARRSSSRVAFMGLAAACLVATQFVAIAFARPALAADEAPKLAGHWVGSLNLTIKLRLVFHVSSSDGKLSATMDSPDQGAVGIAVKAVSLDGKAVKFDLPGIGGAFEGELADDGKSIKGKWKQGGAAHELVLEYSDKPIEPPKRPQTPKPPFSYDELEVVVEHSAGAIRLAGTLTVPRGSGTHPAVVLISGSGPQNRDEELLGHRPFLVLADHLTRGGIAVLRLDDRGVGKSTGNFGTATSLNFADDIEAAVAFLKQRTDIDGRRIGLIGHSEGGLIAPIVANRCADVGFVVLMAGPGVSGEEIMFRQAELIGAAAGTAMLARIINKSVQQQIFDVVKSESDPRQAEDKLRETLKLPKRNDEKKEESPSPQASAMEAQLRMVLTPWFRFFLTYDPKTALEKLHCPTLVLNGEKDLQVDPKQSLPVIEAALNTAKNTRFKIREFPGLNHLFQKCETGGPNEYSTIEETINEEVLRVISDWIKEL